MTEEKITGIHTFDTSASSAARCVWQLMQEYMEELFKNSRKSLPMVQDGAW